MNSTSPSTCISTVAPRPRELDTLLVCDLTEKYGWAGASPLARQQARLHAPPGYGQGGAPAGRFRRGADGAFKRGRRTVTRELVRLHRP